MSEIKLVRIDFRLLHGQVVTSWIRQSGADAVLILDDQLAADKFLAQVFLAAAPPGIKVAVRSIESGVSSFKKDVFKDKKMLVLFKSVPNAKKAYDMGFSADKLQVAGLGNATDRVMISNELSLSKEEAEMLLEIQSGGVEVSMQVTPKDPKISLDDALKTVFAKKE